MSYMWINYVARFFSVFPIFKMNVKLQPNNWCHDQKIFVLLLKIYLFSFMCMSVLSAYMCVYCVCVYLLPDGIRRRHWILWNLSYRQLLWGFWELSPGTLQEQQVLLTMKPSLQPFLLILQHLASGHKISLHVHIQSAGTSFNGD